MIIKCIMLVVNLRKYCCSQLKVIIVFDHYSLLFLLGQARVESDSHRQDARQAKKDQCASGHDPQRSQ